jgi:hypothetical protein
MFFHFAQQIGVQHLLRQPDHIQEGFAARDAMADDDGFRYPEQGCAAVVFEVEAIEVFAFRFMPSGNVKEGFGQFEDDIAGKPFADGDVGFIEQDIPAFDVAHEMDMAILFQQGISRLGQDISLPFFLADIQETYAGLLDAQDMFRIQGAQDGKLIQVLRLAVGVQPDVEQYARPAVVFGNDGGDGGPLDTVDRFEAVKGAHQHGAGVAGADEGIHLAGGQQLKADGDGGLLFFFQGPGRMLIHFDHLAGMDNAHPVPGNGIFLQ